MLVVVVGGTAVGGDSIQSGGREAGRDAAAATEMLGGGSRWQPLSLPRDPEEKTQDGERLTAIFGRPRYVLVLDAQRWWRRRSQT